MIFSRHAVCTKLKDSNKYLLINFLSRQADIIHEDQAIKLMAGRFGELADVEEYKAKQYIIDELAEETAYKAAYLDFLDDREEDEVQVFFVPWYTCNFNCSYCYQSDYSNEPGELDTKVVDAFFEYLDINFSGRSYYITIFGGEPLLPSKTARESISYIADKAARRDVRIAVVTNGYALKEYLPILTSVEIAEIQLTLDGPQQVHDKRRPLKDGSATFDKIVEGIDLLLEHNIPVNLRMVIDKENIEALPELARFAIDRGWTSSPLFKTQLGRNYELHSCQKDRDRLFERAELYEAVYDLVEEHPHILEFHRPAYSVSKFLFEQGGLPQPLFDSCPGTKTEWAADYTGRLYACTATAGKEGEQLGTFFPQRSLDEKAVREWQDRDVLSIPECANCNARLACGGGCAAVSKNRTNRIAGPDCRPVEKLLSMGVSQYFDKGDV